LSTVAQVRSVFHLTGQKEHQSVAKFYSRGFHYELTKKGKVDQNFPGL